MAPRTDLSFCLSLLEKVLPEQLPSLTQDLPAQLIAQALQSTGHATIRRRRLPAEQVVWLVLCMALFRRLSIVNIVDQLGLALPTSRRPVVAAAVHQARARLGKEPLVWLFEQTASTWALRSAKEHDFHGLSLFAVDGTTLRVADSPENRAHFGGTDTHRGPSGYPLLRLVALMAVRSHLLAAAAFGPYGTHELGYADSLWPKLPSRSLVILDRGYFAAWVFHQLQTSGGERHFVIRLRKDFKARVVKSLGRGDDLVEIRVSKAARRQHPELPETMLFRRLLYQRKGFRPQALLTSLLDDKTYPATDVIEVYHERWEIELGYDELKTELLEQRESLRSKSVSAVEQEAWGVLLAYNLVRQEMVRIGKLCNVAPYRLSFAGMLTMMWQLWQMMSLRAGGTIVNLMASWDAQMQRLLLPKRRPRSYPRAVKIKMSNYDRKRPNSDGKRA